MKYKNIYLFFLVPCSLCLVTCGTRNQSLKKIFHYNESTGIALLDPAFSKNQSTMWPVHQLFNTLVENDGDTKTKGSLAKSWDISADRLEYIFHLRTDVTFHDNDAFENRKGRKMLASDVEYSFKRILDTKIASPGFYIFNNVVDSIEGFKAIDDSTFRLKLIKPYSPILQILKMTYCSIVPKEVVEKYGSDFRSHPCGTGPFQFVAWEEGLALIFKKNENYVVVCNHNSLMDVPMTTPFIPGANKTIAKSSFAKVPLFGFYYMKGAVLVDRKNEKSRKESFKKMRWVLRTGLDMVIYPEGTRNRSDDPLKSFYDGAFKLAVSSGKPVMPAVLFNTRKALPTGKFFYLQPCKMEMHFLPPVESTNMTSRELKEKVFRQMWDYYEANK